MNEVLLRFTRPLIAGLMGCQVAPAPATPSPAPVATVEAVDEADPGAVEAGTTDTAGERPAPDEAGEATIVDVGPGVRCALVWDATTFEATDESWNAVGVRRIATRAGGGCQAAVLFDAAAELAACQRHHAASYCEEEPLNGGTLWRAGAPEGNSGIELVDVNFDGHRDLCVEARMGAYNYSQRCWLFRPKEGIFERYEPLDEIIWMTVDADAKVLRHGMRIGGPAYMDQVLGWEAGELVVLERTETILGEDPHGQPLPAGYSRYETRWERRGGQLVKIGAGPTGP